MKERKDTHLDKLADLLENLFLAGLGSENVVELERVAFDLSGSAGSAFCRKTTIASTNDKRSRSFNSNLFIRQLGGIYNGPLSLDLR